MYAKSNRNIISVVPDEINDNVARLVDVLAFTGSVEDSPPTANAIPRTSSVVENAGLNKSGICNAAAPDPAGVTLIIPFI